jgi:hypothetical protein
MERVLFVDETGQPLGLWHDRVKRFHRLAGHLDQGQGQARHVPSGPRQIRDETAAETQGRRDVP